MPDEEGAGGEHCTPADLLELYEILEASGQVTPGDERSVAVQVAES